MEHKDPEIYAALKLGTHNIIGQVKSIHDGQIVLNAVSDDEIPLWSFQHIDVFTNRHIYFRNLPVVVLSDDKIQDDQSLRNMSTRKVKIRYHNSEVADFISRIIGS